MNSDSLHPYIKSATNWFASYLNADVRVYTLDATNRDRLSLRMRGTATENASSSDVLSDVDISSTSLLTKTFLTGKGVHSPVASDAEGFSTNIDGLSGSGEGLSVACFPVLCGEASNYRPVSGATGAMLGAIQVLAPRANSGGFQDTELRGCEIFAERISLALEAKSWRDKFDLLSTMSNAVKSEHDMGMAIKMLLQLAQGLLQADRVQIFLLNEFKKKLDCEASISSTGLIMRPGKARALEVATAEHILGVPGGLTTI